MGRPTAATGGWLGRSELQSLCTFVVTLTPAIATTGIAKPTAATPPTPIPTYAPYLQEMVCQYRLRGRRSHTYLAALDL